MLGPSRSVRRPAVAGRFYPADPLLCADQAEQFLRAFNAPVQGERSGKRQSWIGAIVPHAGWMCSGAIAAQAIAEVRDSRNHAPDVPPVVVVFGAVHTPLPLEIAALASHERWLVPCGSSDVARELSEKLERDGSGLFVCDDRFHENEHAVEVELPLIQQAWPNARLLPVEVPLVDDAVLIGQRTAQALQSAGLDAVYLASSDLTHYGPVYQFTPKGVGPDGLRWANENDRRVLDVVAAFSPELIVPHVRAHRNACGGGAIAAMLAACRELGASGATVLRHANSYEVLRDIEPIRPDNAVGYAAVVVG